MPSQRIMTLAAAAAELGVRADTVRGWIRNGAPVVRQGDKGPGRGALLDPDAVRAWRKRSADDAPLVRLDEGSLARGLMAAFRACSGDIGITQRQLAAVLATAHNEIVRAMTNHPAAEPYPPETRWLIAIAIGSRDVKP
jgi:hypothetical protein